MSVFFFFFSERYCLGGLMKDIDKDLSPREYDFDSKDETSYKTLGEQKLSLDSLYSLNSQKLLFSPSLENNIFFQNASKDNEIHSPSLFSMLSSFNSGHTHGIHIISSVLTSSLAIYSTTSLKVLLFSSQFCNYQFFFISKCRCFHI